MLTDRPKSKVVRWLLNTFGPEGVRLDEFTMQRAGVGSDLDLHVILASEPPLRVRVRARGCRVARRDDHDVIAWDAIEIGGIELPLEAADVVTKGAHVAAGHVRPEGGVPWFVGLALGREG